MEIIVQIFSRGLLLIKISLKNALCLFKIKLLTFNSTKNFSDHYFVQKQSPAGVPLKSS